MNKALMRNPWRGPASTGPNTRGRGSDDRQIAGLDLIRFGSALMIVLHHLGWRVWANNYALPMTYHAFGRYAALGGVGVEIFFVLSGFLIAYSAKNATPGSFLKSRITRLYPAAWICSTLTILIVCGTGHAQMLLRGIPFSQNLSQRWFNSLSLFPLGPWVDGVYWTLGVEISFYLQIFALLALRRFRLLGAWMTGVGLLSTASMAVVHFVTHHGTTHKNLIRFTDAITSRQIAQDLLLRHGCLFALGVLLWMCLLERATWRRVLAAAAMVPGVLLEMSAYARGGEWHVTAAIWAVAVLGMVLSVTARERLHGWLGARGMKLARRLGLMTYPLYLTHQVAGYALLATMKGHLPDLASLAVVVMVMIGLAYLVNRCLEQPLQRTLKAAIAVVSRLPRPMLPSYSMEASSVAVEIETVR